VRFAGQNRSAIAITVLADANSFYFSVTQIVQLLVPCYKPLSAAYLYAALHFN